MRKMLQRNMFGMRVVYLLYSGFSIISLFCLFVSLFFTETYFTEMVLPATLYFKIQHTNYYTAIINCIHYCNKIPVVLKLFLMCVLLFSIIRQFVYKKNPSVVVFYTTSLYVVTQLVLNSTVMADFFLFRIEKYYSVAEKANTCKILIQQYIHSTSYITEIDQLNLLQHANTMLQNTDFSVLGMGEIHRTAKELFICCMQQCIPEVVLYGDLITSASVTSIYDMFTYLVYLFPGIAFLILSWYLLAAYKFSFTNQCTHVSITIPMPGIFTTVLPDSNMKQNHGEEINKAAVVEKPAPLQENNSNKHNTSSKK